MRILPMPKKTEREPIQCINCGKVIHSNHVLLDSKEAIYLCEDCYHGFKKYTLEREFLQQDGNIVLLEALDKGTSCEYANLKNFVDVLTPCYTKSRGGK